MNRVDIESKLGPITSILLKEKGYIAMVDVYMKMGCLTEKNVENWRMRRVPYLEKVIKGSLGKVSFIGKIVRANCINGKLRPSLTVYKSWGKGAKTTLRFSKSGQENIEEAYSTHFLKPKL